MIFIIIIIILNVVIHADDSQKDGIYILQNAKFSYGYKASDNCIIKLEEISYSNNENDSLLILFDERHKPLEAKDTLFIEMKSSEGNKSISIKINDNLLRDTVIENKYKEYSLPLNTNIRKLIIKHKEDSKDQILIKSIRIL